MIQKLELKHVAPYLPYGLRVQFNDGLGECVNWVVSPNKDALYTLSDNEHIQIENLFNEIERGSDYKLILHPFSDLTKEIEVNGGRFVAVENMAEKWVKIFGAINEEAYRSFINNLSNDKGYDLLPHWMFQDLIKWNFDVFGLIESGLAIDINALKIES